MSLIISAEEAYQTYKDFKHLLVKGKKSATFEVIEAILNKFSVKVIPRPCDKVKKQRI